MLLAIGDLQEEILIQLPTDAERGAATPVRSARMRAGSAANVAAIDAESGGTPRFVGQVGDDCIGHLLAEDLRSRGVETRIRHEGGTGVGVTMVGSDHRSRLLDRGASLRLSLIDSSVLDGVSQVYLAASAFVEDPLASAVDRLLAEIHDLRLPVVLGGPGQAELGHLGEQHFLDLVATVHPDAVVLNREEHAALGMAPRGGIRGASATVITAGARPTVVVEEGKRVESAAVPPVTDIRDRTGVGDGFLAGFMASRRAGADAISATHAGHRIAAKVLGRLGPSIGA